MKQLQVFTNNQFGNIRAIEKDGQPYFVGKDIAERLGYARPTKAIQDHCKGILKQDIGVTTGFKADGTPTYQKVEMSVIPEGDVYRLIIKSKLPQAEQFEKWVMEEVLPGIRKTGQYSVANTISIDVKETLRNDIGQIVEERIKEIEDKCSEYYRPSSAEKYNISQYIKKRLGIRKANDEYELVKQRTLIKLGAKKWEDVDIETLKSSLNIIDESIRVIKADRPYEQRSMFDI